MKPILSLPFRSLPNVFITLYIDRNLNFAANNLAHDVYRINSKELATLE